MKFNDLLSEQEIYELGVLKKIKAGVQGAVAGYKSSGLRRKGQEHSLRIADNIKSEFEQMVGGGLEPTYKNLIDFLDQLGLDNLQSIPNPKASAAKPATAPSTTDVDQRIEPTMEDVEPELNPYEIDKIIKDAVRKNYARIVAAQQGRSLPSQKAEEPVDSKAGAGAFNNMAGQLSKEKPNTDTEEPADPGAGAFSNMASQMSKGKTQAPKAEPAPANVKADFSIDAFTKAYSTLTPQEREDLRKQLDIIDDQERLASGTNENLDKPRSKYLGIDL